MIEADDGRNYFDYNKGCAFEIHGRRNCGSVLHTLIIEDMRVSESGEELYTTVTEKDGERFAFKEFTSSQLGVYLETSCGAMVQEGIPVEFPLIASDVKYYYSAKKKACRLALERANFILIGTQERDKNGKLKKDKNGKTVYEGGIEEYRDLLKEQEQLEQILAKRYANNEITETQESMYRNVCKKRAEIIKEKGIPLKLFVEETLCQICGGKGLDEKGNICMCALAQETEIKAFCAAKRLEKNLSLRWADKFLDTDEEDEPGEELGEDQEEAEINNSEQEEKDKD